MKKKANKKIFFLVIFSLLTIIIGGAITGYFLLHSPIPTEFLRFQKQSRQINSKLCAIKKDAARKISSQKWEDTNLNCASSKNFTNFLAFFQNFLVEVSPVDLPPAQSGIDADKFIGQFIAVLHSTKQISDNYLSLHSSTSDFNRLNSLINDIRDGLDEAESTAQNLQDIVDEISTKSSAPSQSSENSVKQTPSSDLFVTLISKLEGYQNKTEKALLKMNKKIFELEKTLQKQKNSLIHTKERLNYLENKIEQLEQKIQKQEDLISTKKIKKQKLQELKAALHALSTDSTLITFTSIWAKSLAENTPAEIDFNVPEGKDLTDYKLKVSYSDEATTFEILDTEDTQIWSSETFESGPIEEASQIDSDLLTTIIQKVEEEWGKEWKKESGQTFLTSLQNSFANLDKNGLTTEINDSENFEQEYETNFTLTKSSADGTEIDFTINLKFQLFSSDEDAKVWEKEWAITSASYTLDNEDGEENPEETTFEFVPNSNIDTKIAKINSDLEMAAATEAQVRKLQAFIEKLKIWDADLTYVTTTDLNWGDLSESDQITLEFTPPADKGLSTFTLQTQFDGTNIVFKILDSENGEIWTSDTEAATPFSKPDKINAALRTTIIEQVEAKWAGEWNAIQKTNVINSLKTITNIVGEPSESSTMINELTINIEFTNDDDLTVAFVVTATIGPEDTDQDSKPWDREWKILTASISAPGGEPEEVGLTGVNANRISQINNKLTELKTEKDKATKLVEVIAALHALSTDSALITFADNWADSLTQNTPVEIDFVTPGEKQLTDYKLKISYNDEAITFEILNEEPRTIWTSTNLASGPITEALQIDSNLLATIVQKLEAEWEKEWKKESGQTFLTSLQNSFDNLEKSKLTTEINDSDDLDKEYETSLTLSKSSAEGTDFEFTIKLKFRLSSSDGNAKAWAKEWTITEATYTLSGESNAVEIRFTFVDNSDNDAKIATINEALETVVNTLASARKLQTFIDKLKTWDDGLAYLTTTDSTWDSLSTGNPITVNFAPPTEGEWSTFTLRVSYSDEAITFEILDDEENNIWSSSAYSVANLINRALITEINTQVESVWIQEHKQDKKEQLKRLINQITNLRNSQMNELPKQPNDGPDQFSYFGSLNFVIENEVNILPLSITIGPSPLSQDSDFWEFEYLIAAAQIRSQVNPDSSTIALSGLNTDRINQINEAIKMLKSDLLSVNEEETKTEKIEKLNLLIEKAKSEEIKNNLIAERDLVIHDDDFVLEDLDEIYLQALTSQNGFLVENTRAVNVLEEVTFSELTGTTENNRKVKITWINTVGAASFEIYYWSGWESISSIVDATQIFIQSRRNVPYLQQEITCSENKCEATLGGFDLLTDEWISFIIKSKNSEDETLGFHHYDNVYIHGGIKIKVIEPASSTSHRDKVGWVLNGFQNAQSSGGNTFNIFPSTTDLREEDKDSEDQPSSTSFFHLDREETWPISFGIRDTVEFEIPPVDIYSLSLGVWQKSQANNWIRNINNAFIKNPDAQDLNLNIEIPLFIFAAGNEAGQSCSRNAASQNNLATNAIKRNRQHLYKACNLIPVHLIKKANFPNDNLIIVGDSETGSTPQSNLPGEFLKDRWISTYFDWTTEEDLTSSPFRGTSFGTPYVARVSAEILRRAPHYTAEEIANLIFDTAIDAGEVGTDAVYGRGILNPTGIFAELTRRGF